MPHESLILNVVNKLLKKNHSNCCRTNGYYLSGIVFFLTILCTITLSVYMLLNWMKDVNQFPISKIVITGERHYTCDDDIRKAILTLGMPGTFMTIDLNAVYNQIKTMSWIKKVTVRKQWPNSLKIYLVEYKPYAKWNDIFLVNTEGNIFSLPGLLNIKGNFLMLYGPEGTQKEVLEMYRFMQSQFAPHNFKIKSVSMTVRRSWKLVLSNDIRLNIGKYDVKERLNRFIKLSKLLKQSTYKRIEYIDLRYANGAAVGWLPLLIKQSYNN
ncbi:MAG: cell division protein FtsQ/DivIB [Arsenophonus sp.]